MKYLFSLFIFASIMPSAHAVAREDLAACGVADPRCRETAPTCATFYQCDIDFLKTINSAWYSAVFHAQVGRARACSRAYKSQRLTVEANATTIDCTDTDHGPSIGG